MDHYSKRNADLANMKYALNNINTKRLAKISRSRFTQPCCSMLFRINLASVRSFEGCNVVRFTVIETNDTRVKFVFNPPLLRDVLQSYV